MKVRSAALAAVLLAGLVPVRGFAQTAPGGEAADGQQTLFSPKDKSFGWDFDNGREFPGATGGLSVDREAKHEGKESLKLEGNFTKGGNYVQMGRHIPDLDISSLVLWVRDPDQGRLTLRINDATGQCHQIALKTPASPDWQQIAFPLEQFFAHRGQSDAVTTVAKYESWGGANDSQWHGPAKGIYLLMGPEGEKREKKVRTVWVGDVRIAVRVAAPAVPDVKTVLRLDEFPEDEADWGFTLGQEFKGAGGSLTLVKDLPAKGQACLKLSGDFTKGGAYVAALKDLKPLDARDIESVRLKIRSDNAASIGIQFVDGTGQCHQNKAVAIVPDGQWHDLVLKPSEIAGGEHWGGANDGRWHGGPDHMAISVSNGSDPAKRQPTVYLADIRAEALVAAAVHASSFQEGFEASGQVPAGWKTEGRVSIDSQDAFKGSRSLRVARSLDEIDTPASATSPPLAVAAGVWEIGVACSSDLHSPDNSYNGTVRLECLGAAGNLIEAIPLGELFGKRNWQLLSRRVEPPQGTVAARFKIQLNKADGQFHVDQLSAASVSAAPRKDRRIDRIVFSTAQLGNMLYPDDKLVVGLSVETLKPLGPKQREITCVVRDYWGAEYSIVRRIALTRAGKSGRKIVYSASIDLGDARLEMGKYYELNAKIAQEGDEPFHNSTSLAILPKAETKKYRPEEIPFTSRSWDNRLKDYFDLSDRIGLRTCGIWGGWSSDPPYKADAPSIDNCERLDMGVLTGTPANAIEYRRPGYEKYDEKALRQGARNWVAAYGKHRPLIVNLGNEPHGTGEQVKANVAAYRVLYDELKKIDPSIFVVGTSVGPEEEYFQAGFQNYCDAYDFHVYEDSGEVRRRLAIYRDMFKKYGGEKPVWSTELGLNSQGLTRHAVAVELIKKLTVFFAAGGQNASWFGIMYPDPDAKSQGSSGEAHNVFDCRYSRYCPRLDAIAYYNVVNGLCIKKFVAEKQYAGGIHAFLFRDRDNRCLQVVWKDKGRQDVLVPLAGVEKVGLIGIDGASSELCAGGRGVTLSVDEDPRMLLYGGTSGPLAEELGAPSAGFVTLPPAVVNGESTMLEVGLRDVPEDGVSLVAPPAWHVGKVVGGKDASGSPLLRFALTPPETSAARECNLRVPVKDRSGRNCGELSARIPVAGRLAVRLLPEPAADNKPAGVKLILKNNSMDRENVTWKLSLVGEIPMAEGKFGAVVSTNAYFAEAAEGSQAIDGHRDLAITVPIAGIQQMTVYRVRAAVTDASGRTTARERFVAGFVTVPKVKAPLKLDGVLDEGDWERSPVQLINDRRQYRALDSEAAGWKGPADLSAKIRYLWDDQYLYVGVHVTDDVYCNPREGDALWAQDGLQFLIDPAREFAEKPGKYDYVMGVGRKGPQAWCSLSASGLAPVGEAKDILVAAKRATDGTGGITYELAIPWSRVSPFLPAIGANLGVAMILNEDDGAGRHSFMGWFGDPHEKQVDFVGDLILGK